jgi:probable rRNA maturation factor
LSIRIFYDGVDYRLRSWKKVRNLVEKVISDEGKISGDLNFILTTDEALLELNRKFLKHNYFTDVISFRSESRNLISGEVYISVDTVKINSKNYKVSYTAEMLRVIIHGVLHLCGLDDGTERERLVMRERENYWLNIFDSL